MFWIIKLWNLHLSVEIFAKDFQVPVNSSKKVFALKILQRTTHTVSPYHRIIVLYCTPYLGIVSPAALEKVQGRRNPFWMQLTVNKTDSMDSRCAHNRKSKTKPNYMLRTGAVCIKCVCTMGVIRDAPVTHRVHW